MSFYINTVIWILSFHLSLLQALARNGAYSFYFSYILLLTLVLALESGLDHSTTSISDKL